MKVIAPWSPEQVANLKRYQGGLFHPYTCRVDSRHGALVPLVTGWECPRRSCEYTQDWAHAMTMDTETLDALERAPHHTEPYLDLVREGEKADYGSENDGVCEFKFFRRCLEPAVGEPLTSPQGGWIYRYCQDHRDFFEEQGWA